VRSLCASLTLLVVAMAVPVAVAQKIQLSVDVSRPGAKRPQSVRPIRRTPRPRCLRKQDRDRREREAAEKNQVSKPRLSAEQQRWKQLAAEKLGSYRSHSQKAAYYKAYDDALASTNSYRAAFEAVLRVWKAYNPI
jgi:hypothetical protein